MKEYIQRYKAKSGKFKGKNIVTVCTIINDEGKASRGVSVCSPSDNPSEKSGEFWARCYAEHAIKKRPDIAITDYRAIRTILYTDCPFVMQSNKNPVLTFQEIAFFYGKKRIVDNFKLKENYVGMAFKNIDTVIPVFQYSKNTLFGDK